MSLLDKLGAKTEAEAFWKEVDKDVDTAERNRIVKAAESLAWAVTWRVLLKLGMPLGALVFVGVVIAGSQITGETPPLTVSGGDTIKVIAKEPGAVFDVMLFCNDPTTKVGKTAMTDAPLGGTRYIASRGTESVNWADSPEDKNPSAVFYATGPNGSQTGLPVEITKPAADCLRKKAK